VRYALSLYIKQIRFVFKGLKKGNENHGGKIQVSYENVAYMKKEDRNVNVSHYLTGVPLSRLT
jgi:hypothetical protein